MCRRADVYGCTLEEWVRGTALVSRVDKVTFGRMLIQSSVPVHKDHHNDACTDTISPAESYQE